MKHVLIMGVPILYINQRDFVSLLDERIRNRQKAFVVTANPEIIMKVSEDSTYKKAVDKATYITADGIGVVKAAKLLNDPLPERVTGFDTTIQLLEVANNKRYRIYLFGAKSKVLKKTVQNITRDYPNVIIVGSRDGFTDLNNQSIANEIEALKPDIIFVALGVPRQEKWIADNLDTFDYGVFIGIGGSFDVISGTVKRASIIWQKLNLEWLYRLLKQPSRWRRMLTLIRFTLLIFKRKIIGINK